MKGVVYSMLIASPMMIRREFPVTRRVAPMRTQPLAMPAARPGARSARTKFIDLRGVDTGSAGNNGGLPHNADSQHRCMGARTVSLRPRRLPCADGQTVGLCPCSGLEYTVKVGAQNQPSVRRWPLGVCLCQKCVGRFSRGRPRDFAEVELRQLVLPGGNLPHEDFELPLEQQILLLQRRRVLAGPLFLREGAFVAVLLWDIQVTAKLVERRPRLLGKDYLAAVARRTGRRRLAAVPVQLPSDQLVCRLARLPPAPLHPGGVRVALTKHHSKKIGRHC
mmetsp:Transcript_14106/g.22429  ORF Transcript_14106/g.22429 Transcript_14106/m.22429 type:complete len:278 (+) Transcript_14106:708-1541(+)